MSENRFEDIAQSAGGGDYYDVNVSLPLRYIEIDRSDQSSTGGDLLLFVNSQVVSVPCDPTDPNLYTEIDAIVRDQERLVIDLGDIFPGNTKVRIIESQGAAFSARLLTDTEEIRNHREGLMKAELTAGSDVVALSPPITRLHATTVAVSGAAAVEIPLIADNGLFFKNRHATAVLWVGSDNTVTNGAGANAGYPLDPGDSAEFQPDELTASAHVWVIYDTGTAATPVHAVRPGA